MNEWNIEEMFASEHEGVIPDMMVMAKGLTAGYLPLAITLISEKLFSAFDGSVSDGKALAYGHSYTGNALACAAAKEASKSSRTNMSWKLCSRKAGA